MLMQWNEYWCQKWIYSTKANLRPYLSTKQILNRDKFVSAIREFFSFIKN